MELRELIEADRDEIYLNLNDFAELHKIDGVEVVCVIDQDIEQTSDPVTGMIASDMRIFVKSEDVCERSAGDVLNVDGRLCIVNRWRVDFGLACIDVTGHGM